MIDFIRENIKRVKNVKRTGSGFVNTLINKLPFELHIPGYNYCGPGTKLSKRLARGDKGVNPLDESCRKHDIAYSEFKDLDKRHEADKQLIREAKSRITATDASIGEKASALAVTGIIGAKTKLGMGNRRVGKGSREKKRRGKKVSGSAIKFNTAVKRASKGISGISNVMKAATVALNSVKRRRILSPKTRIIPIPKSGGFLPLIPLFAALGALGSIGGGAAGIAKAVNDAKAAKEQLEEQKRHNKAMEQVSLGNGLYLKPYKKGLGLHIKKNCR